MTTHHADEATIARLLELETLVAQQAAVIEQMVGVLKAYDGSHSIDQWDENLMPSRAWDKARVKALALQPCPEVLNKVRADAVREACKQLDPAGTWGIRRNFADYADRIEQGEA